MPSKKNPAPKKPVSLDEQAIDLHNKIAECEDKAAPLYLKLGAVLVDIKEEQQCDWKGLLAYATDTLDLRRSRVVRALRIWKLHHDDPTAVINGLTLYEALAHEKKSFTMQPVGSPLTAREYQAVMRFEKAVGGEKRAVEVLTRVAVERRKAAEGQWRKASPARLARQDVRREGAGRRAQGRSWVRGEVRWEGAEG